MKPRTMLLAALCAASPASAADLSVGLDGGFFSMTASNSADAIFGSSGGGRFGGSLRYGLGKRFFVGAGASVFRKEGERVFLADRTSTVYRLGHPLKMRIVPIFGLVGFRLFPQKRLVPYIAAGGGTTKYNEESTVGGVTEETSQSKFGGQFLAGAEWGRGRLRVGAELGYAIAPSTIGLGGVSKIYGEDDIGGFSVTGRIVFGRSRR